MKVLSAADEEAAQAADTTAISFVNVFIGLV
jgi:hypothetical protein